MSTISPETTRIGWIGTGVMGAPMCGHLLAAGYSATVFSRTQAKAQPLLDQGATWAESPREVAAAADVVFSIVGYPADVRSTLLGESGALAGAAEGTILVDMTTSEPSLAVEIAERAQAKGANQHRCPRLRRRRRCTQRHALDHDWRRTQSTVEALAPIWGILGSTWVWQGGPGAGQHTKMVNQTLIASNMVGVCEAMLYAQRAGLNPEQVLRSVSTGAAGSWSLSNLAPRMLAGDFAPGFFVEHFIKDMGIALEESKRMQLELPGLALAEKLYQELATAGHARNGTQALVLALAKLSEVDWQCD